MRGLQSSETCGYWRILRISSKGHMTNAKVYLPTQASHTAATQKNEVLHTYGERRTDPATPGGQGTRPMGRPMGRPVRLR